MNCLDIEHTKQPDNKDERNLSDTLCSLVRRMTDWVLLFLCLSDVDVNRDSWKSRAITNGRTRSSARTSHAILSVMSPNDYSDEVGGGNLSTDASPVHKPTL